MKDVSEKTIFGILEKDHQEVLQNLNRLYEALEKLRYEGKAGLGRNLAQVRSLLAYFKNTLPKHMAEEERSLFPFLRTHIPRLEPVICLLISEHREFKECIAGLKKALHSRHLGFQRIETVCDRGVYLVCLLRSHLWVESRNLYLAADTELLESEKNQLIRQIGEHAPHGHHLQAQCR